MALRYVLMAQLWQASYSTSMKILKAVERAVFEHAMLHDGDRVLIGASGGKDSIALSALLVMLASRGRSIQLGAAYVQGGHASKPQDDQLERIASIYEGLGIRFDVLKGESLNGQPDCYRCSSMRRKALMHHAAQHGYNKIALGHHLDDILTSALMNLVLRGQAGAMKPVREYPRFGFTLIRPLAYVPEESIRRFVASRGWLAMPCSCGKGTSGDRADFRQRLEALAKGSLKAKRALYKGLSAGISSC